MANYVMHSHNTHSLDSVAIGEQQFKKFPSTL